MFQRKLAQLLFAVLLDYEVTKPRIVKVKYFLDAEIVITGKKHLQ